MSRMKARDPLSSLDPGRGPLVSPRAILALVLIVSVALYSKSREGEAAQ